MVEKASRFRSLSEIPGVIVETGKAAKLLRQAFSGHYYRRESLLKPEVVRDMGKLEDAMARKDKPYWSIQDVYELMGATKKNDLSRRLYVSSLLDYLREEGRVTTGGPNALNQYILTKRADEITQQDMMRQTGNMQIR